MNIENHPVVKVLKVDKEKIDLSSPDMTRTKISQSMDLQVINEDVPGGFDHAMLHIDKLNAAVFTCQTKISPNVNPLDVFATDIESIHLYAPFLRLFTKTMIGSDITLPISLTDGALPGLKLLIEKESHSTGEIGRNYLLRETIQKVIDDMPKKDIIATETGAVLREHFIYLPITSYDIARDILDFDAFPPQVQSTIRLAKEYSLSKTYIRILLLDGTEFVLWCNSSSLGIIGKNK